ncbi:ADP-ribosylation factor-binding protein GGA3a [Pygocentrus nattereri]|uniref:ADP-ribosylation factor-binding protein GGA3 n=1 Tax=Pygocentrus nattereri TaxID=42514 RepID=A0A3B4C8Y3_PYGNA|nr:ADP-ribosylation factor-binding protein GGA3a [Pygocentrus nattereri]
MADPEGESLESWLNKATNPSNRQEDWEYIIGFCDQINKELEGPQISVRLLAHKIQSPQEWEALQALTVLEACMKNCGRRFHNEVGKFRFLNELIKVVSPKYLGDRVSEKVKIKVIEMLFSWSTALPDETKITEAYQMLKRQGIVTTDPEVPADKTLIPSPPDRPHNPVFENEEKSKRLAELLKSKKPEDLQEANRLIKNMVKEDEARVQKVAQRTSTLLEVNNSVKLLNEMLRHFSKDQSTQADRELLKDLHDDCDKLRTTVFKLATETEDDDSSLGEILQASDDLSRVINSYKSIVEGQAVNTDTPGSTTSERTDNGSSSEILIDLAGLDVHTASLQHPPLPSAQIPADLFMSPPAFDPPPPYPNSSSAQPGLQVNIKDSPNRPIASENPNSLSLLDEELISLGLSDPVTAASTQKQENEDNQWTALQASNPLMDLLSSSPPLDLLQSAAPATPESTSASDSSRASESFGGVAPLAFPAPAQSVSTSLQDLALLDLGKPSDPAGLAKAESASLPCEGGGPAVTSSTKPPNSAFPPDSPLLHPLSPPLVARQGTAAPQPDPSLTNVFVPLDSIRPSKESPVTAYDKDGVCVLLHFASNCPPGRPDVLVMVVSMLNTAPLQVKNLTLQAAVPKSMRVKLQPPSGMELAPFNPILPPSAITQVMLLANPLKEKMRLRYKLMFVLGDRQCSETGEVDKFPPVERWGRL